MPNMLLLSDNIVSLKESLRTIYPLVKSAHLSEGIARALGFNSNAALRIAIGQSKIPKIKLACFDEQLFQNWLSQAGYNIKDGVPWSCFEQVDVPIWMISKSKALIDQCFFHARANNIPMVHINKKTKCADVHWDFISVDESHEPKKFTREDLMKLSAIMAKYNGKAGSLGFSVFTGTIYQLSIDDAKAAADEIFAILHNLILPLGRQEAA